MKDTFCNFNFVEIRGDIFFWFFLALESYGFKYLYNTDEWGARRIVSRIHKPEYFLKKNTFTFILIGCYEKVKFVDLWNHVVNNLSLQLN